MKYFGLLWSGLWRRRTRTILTLLAIVMAFALFGILQGIDISFKQLVNQGRLNVLVTTNPAGLSLPLSQLAQIRAVKGVSDVTYRGLFIGYFRSLTSIVVALPVDADHFFDLQKEELTVSAADLAALKRTRTGVLMTRALGERLHWKVGDHVPVNAINAPKKDGTSVWTFDIVGYFDLPNSPSREQSILIMNYPYYDTARATDNGTVQLYVETIADAAQAPVIANAIDNLFANSPNRTHTDTERAYAQSQLAQIGDLDFFVDAIVAAAFATLLLLTGTTLMQSYRERTAELAVMKTLGFTDGGVAALVVSEALLLCLGAAALGMLGAEGLLKWLQRLQGQLPGMHVPGIVFLAGMLVAVGVALISSLLPAWQARRLSIVTALTVR